MLQCNSNSLARSLSRLVGWTHRAPGREEGASESRPAERDGRREARSTEARRDVRGQLYGVGPHACDALEPDPAPDAVQTAEAAALGRLRGSGGSSGGGSSSSTAAAALGPALSRRRRRIGRGRWRDKGHAGKDADLAPHGLLALAATALAQLRLVRR